MIKNQLIVRKPQDPYGLVAELNLPITLGRSATPLGKDQEIDRYVTEETLAAIPEVKDRELVRFRLKTEPDEARFIIPYFRNSGGTQVNTYQAAGFSIRQAQTLAQGLARSMYIFELYDSSDSDTQVLLSRAYCKGDDAYTYEAVNDANGNLTYNKPLLRVATVAGAPTPLAPLALPVYFLRNQPTGTIYLRISFFNSVTGKRIRLRNRNGGSSIAESNHVPLTYDATSRFYHMPKGNSVDMEEVVASVTNAEAEAERKKRLANMETTPRLGVFQPLGPPQAINYFTTTGSTTGNGTIPPSGSTSGSTTGPSALVVFDVPGTLVTVRPYITLSAAHLMLSTESVTGIRTTTGILTVGLPAYRPSDPPTKVSDGWYAYVVTGSYPPPRVLRIQGGIITQLNIPNPDIVNVIQVTDTSVDTTRYTLSRTACSADYDGDAITYMYAPNGVLQIGGPIYTQPNLGGRLADGYYKFNDKDANQLVLRIQYAVINSLDINCSFGGHPPTEPGL